MSLQRTHFLNPECVRRNPFVTRPRYEKAPLCGAFSFIGVAPSVYSESSISATMAAAASAETTCLAIFS